VEVILEAAAQVLEAAGLEGYTTNHIAERAGVSIGSLYQYFPNKDAVTVALIERDASTLAEALLALDRSEWKATLLTMIELVAEHDRCRPRLARLLDSEEVRMRAESVQRQSAEKIRVFLEDLLGEAAEFPLPVAVIVSDLMALTRGLSNGSAASDPTMLARRIEWAVLGYLELAARSSHPAR
jgi:AcrR family transcriptional regulator